MEFVNGEGVYLDDSTRADDRIGGVCRWWEFVNGVTQMTLHVHDGSSWMMMEFVDRVSKTLYVDDGVGDVCCGSS